MIPKFLRLKPKRLMRDVEGYLLSVSPEWDNLTKEQIEELSNGIGPERWDPAVRNILSSFTGFWAPSSAHDIDYCVGHTADDRYWADFFFQRNCYRVLWKDLGGITGLWNRELRVKALIRFGIAKALFRILRVTGRKAFEQAHKITPTPAVVVEPVKEKPVEAAAAVAPAAVDVAKELQEIRAMLAKLVKPEAATGTPVPAPVPEVPAEPEVKDLTGDEDQVNVD